MSFNARACLCCSGNKIVNVLCIFDVPFNDELKEAWWGMKTRPSTVVNAQCGRQMGDVFGSILLISVC
jgi:hypothetical protein